MIEIRGELVEIINSKEGRIRPPLNEKTDGIVIVSSQSLAEQLRKDGYSLVEHTKDGSAIYIIPAPQEKAELPEEINPKDIGCLVMSPEYPYKVITRDDGIPDLCKVINQLIRYLREHKCAP